MKTTSLRLTPLWKFAVAGATHEVRIADLRPARKVIKAQKRRQRSQLTQTQQPSTDDILDVDWSRSFSRLSFLAMPLLALLKQTQRPEGRQVLLNLAMNVLVVDTPGVFSQFLCTPRIESCCYFPILVAIVQELFYWLPAKANILDDPKTHMLLWHREDDVNDACPGCMMIVVNSKIFWVKWFLEWRIPNYHEFYSQKVYFTISPMVRCSVQMLLFASIWQALVTPLSNIVCKTFIMLRTRKYPIIQNWL